MKKVIKLVILGFGLFLMSCLTAYKNDSKQVIEIIEIKVDETGYHPNQIKVSKEVESVTLRFKRVTDHTCAREVVYEEQSINKSLPVNESVEITFDLRDKERIIYGCHMNKMHKGVISKR